MNTIRSDRPIELPRDIPDDVAQALRSFCAALNAAFGSHLRSVVLFGSAAEGRMRATSDVNVLVVLDQFDRKLVDPIREEARLARATVRLQPMFMLGNEIALAADAFAVKFEDILSRRFVLTGEDPFAGMTIPRDRIIYRLRQVLLDTTIRLRATYVLTSLREEQLAREVADAAAPLRSSALSIRVLEGHQAASPKAALEAIAADLPGGPWNDVLTGFSDAREDGALAPGAAPDLLMRIIALAAALRERVDRLGISARDRTDS